VVLPIKFDHGHSLPVGQRIVYILGLTARGFTWEE